MSDGELVVFALGRIGKTADATGAAQQLKTRLAAGDDLVRVALVAHVPQQLIALEIEDVVQRQRQLDRPEVAGQVPPGLADTAQDELTDLLRQSFQLGHRQQLQVRRAADLVQILTHTHIVPNENARLF